MAVWTSSTILLLIISMQLVPADSVPAIIEGVTAVPAVAVGRPALMITWRLRNGDGTITTYEIENRVTGTEATGLAATATETMYTIQSLQPGTTYDIRVRAVSTEGEGAWSAWISGTTFNGPPTPDGVSVQPSTTAGQLEITWTEATANDGTTITGYSLQYRRTSDNSSYTTVEINGGDTTSRVLMGLDLGTGYSVRIASVDDHVGLGDYNDEDKTGHTYGYAPTLSVSTSALAQRGKIQVSWTTPTPPTGSSIMSYSIQYRVKGSSGAYTPITGIVSTATSHTISELTLGAEYEVRATALTEIGATSTTYGQALVTVYENSPVPSTPSVQSRTTAGHLLVSWTKPTANDGTAITGYSLQYRRTSDSSSSYTTVQINGEDTTSRVLMGLDSGTDYSVRIASVDDRLGLGGYSQETSGYTYGYSPALPVSASALAQRGKIQVSWTTPTPPTGSSIMSYSIQYRVRGSSGAYTPITGIVSTATSHTISGLTLGAEYEVRATAQTEIGATSSTYGQALVTVYEDSPVPSTPSVQSRTTAGHLLVSWTKPTANDGTAITGYSLQYRKTSPSSSSYTTVQINGGDTTSRVLMGLDLGTGYSVRIASVDDRLGLGGYSQETSGYTYGYSPTLIVSASALAQRGEIQVSWTTPTPPTGSSILSYSIQYRVSGSSGAYTPMTGIVSTATSHTISGLTLGTEYEVRATARTEIGATSSTYGQAFVTVYKDSPVPSTPSVQPKMTAGQLLVSWTKPTVNDGSTITGYSLQYRKTSPSSSSYTTVQIIGGDITSRVLMSLDRGTGYSVRIAATNQLGTGSYSSEQSATTYKYSPVLSVSASALAQRGKIRVSWTTPTPPTGSSIISYSIQYRVRGSIGAYTHMTGIDSAATSHTISGLTLGAEYEVRATALTEIGATSSTYGQAFVTTHNVPPQVENLTITVLKTEAGQGSKRLTVTWTPPQSDQPITSYDVSYRVIQPTVVWVGQFSPPSTQHMHSYAVAEGQDYEVRVRAVSVIGGGEYDTQRTIVPDEPAITSRQYYETSIKLTWTRSGADDFIIYYKKAQTDSTEYLSMDSTEPIATITGLESNTHYKMIIGARNRFGSTNSSIIDTYTLAEAPGPVSNLSYIVRSISNAVTEWSPPTTPNRAITQYSVIVQEVEESWTQQVNQTGLSYSVTDLRAYIPYNVTVTAHTSVGAGEPTSIILFTVEGVPQVPIEITTVEQIGESSILVEWKGLSLREAKGFPYYIVTYTSLDGTATATFTTNQSRLVITGLQADTGYHITLQAGTSVGLGPKITRYFKTAKVDSADDSSLVAIGAGVSVGILAMVAILVAVIIVAIWAIKRRSRQADNEQDNYQHHEAIYDEVHDTIAVGKADDGIKMKKSQAYDEVHFNVYENMTKL